MVIKGEGSGDFFTQKANINRKIEAFKKVKYVVCYEQQMNTSCCYEFRADILYLWSDEL